MKSILWKKKVSKNGLLYVILDTEVIKEANLNILSLADKLAYYGVDFLQLRSNSLHDKFLLELAKKLKVIIAKRKRTFIINNRVDIAYLSNAHGLHIGKHDICARQARKILGEKSIIGKTVHSFDELKSFQKEKINYISIGPAFKTKTKPALPALNETKLENMLNCSKKLMFAIGGINLYNIKSLMGKGISNVAVCRDIILSKNIKKCVKGYIKCLKKVY